MNESLIVFSSNITVKDVVRKLRSINSVRAVAKSIRKNLLYLDFGLNHKFCDAEEIVLSWKETFISGELLNFVRTSFNVKESLLISNHLNEDMSSEDPGESDKTSIQSKGESIQTAKDIFKLCFTT